MTTVTYDFSGQPTPERRGFGAGSALPPVRNGQKPQACGNYEVKELALMNTRIENREGRIVDRMVEAIILAFCLTMGVCGLLGLNALPVL